jgi:glycine cleavage system H lipoate-binding protein
LNTSQEKLGDIVYVELPDVNDEVEKGGRIIMCACGNEVGCDDAIL